MNTISDQAQRTKALDVNQSFIVQAPAGSGKTELLTQRFLKLLSIVRKMPEEVVAITFTRKAATQMRGRIYQALLAATNPAPEQPHALLTWQLARQVLERDQLNDWKLLENPNRLQLLTIDALCGKITKSVPIVSQFGLINQIIENAKPLYFEAAKSLITSLNDHGAEAVSLRKLLLHLDNNYFVAQNLFVDMLCRRDQWLPHIMDHRHIENARSILEENLQNIITDTLKKAHRSLSLDIQVELVELFRFSVKNLNLNSSILDEGELICFPSCSANDHPKWARLIELLLTKSYQWRKSVTKNCGFPPATEGKDSAQRTLYKNMKTRMVQLLDDLSKNESLRNSLQNILLLPSCSYSDDQWEIIQALLELLPTLVAHLHIIFRERRTVDFIAMAQSALLALSESDQPTDLALNLDHRISHLLVDEFQDISLTQYRLIELLTAGWQENDGRTLFLVGDPMQSIYRFREAQVGIFLKVRKFGLGSLQLQPLTLSVNFRSQPGIIQWLNSTFSAAFPLYENIELGAITYSPSVAYEKDSLENENVYLHPLYNPDEMTQANYVINLIKAAQYNNPEQTIAVLVRSRNHLRQIIPAFKKEGLTFQAIEIERLIYSPVVSDLLALTKALCHLGDRIAWLAILRAPWCGLTLADLLVIAQPQEQIIWQNLNDATILDKLSTEGLARINRIVPILKQAIQNRCREHLRKSIAYTWYKLGGPACLDDYYEVENTNAFFALIDEIQVSGNVDLILLEEKLNHAYAHPLSKESNLHVMTVHKAKGLEYDMVILPGLEKKSATDENRLLLWLDRHTRQGEGNLILAPIKSFSDEFDSIYRYIKTQDTTKSSHEATRLLYVALTRTKKVLHLLGSVFSNEKNKLKEPISGSFLKILWPKISNKFQLDAIELVDSPKINNQPTHYFKRFTLNWQPSEVLKFFREDEILLAQNKFNWSMHHLQHVGTVIHQALQSLSMRIDKHVDFKTARIHWKNKLSMLGVAESNLINSLKLVEKAISNTLADQRGQWILNHRHQEARSELALTANLNNELVQLIIDRTFIDEEGYRWIIDYKTSEVAADDPTSFMIACRKKYAHQLENYARAISLIDNRPIKLGLYFPLFSAWDEWEFI